MMDEDDIMDGMMKELNQKVYKEAGDHNERVRDSMLVATTYLAVGSRILRTLLDEGNYKRFMEDFPNWVRIFNARAKKFGTKEDSDIDVSLNLLNESKLGK